MKKLLENKKLLAIIGGVLAVVVVIVIILCVALRAKPTAAFGEPATEPSTTDVSLYFGMGDPATDETSDPNALPSAGAGDMNVNAGGNPNASPNQGGSGGGDKNVNVGGNGSNTQKPGTGSNQKPGNNGGGNGGNNGGGTGDPTKPTQTDPTPPAWTDPSLNRPTDIGGSGTEIPESPMDLSVVGLNGSASRALQSILKVQGKYYNMGIDNSGVEKMTNAAVTNYAKTGNKPSTLNTKQYGLAELIDFHATSVTVSGTLYENEVAQKIFDAMQRDPNFVNKAKHSFYYQDGALSVFQDGGRFFVLYAAVNHYSN